MEKLSFKTLNDCYAVVIPMLQRDYAYGRIDESEKRDSFLSNLRSYFMTSDPHELDFIYGSVDSNNNLKLLDGQQRITTLFLLHWYLALVKNQNNTCHFSEFKEMMMQPNGESKFSYKTRFSSTDFCNAIVKLEFKGVNYEEKYCDAVNDNSIKLSEVIRHEKWFLPHWNYDPTIDSMLNMLDSIKKFFVPEECGDYYCRLINDGQIVFNFLNLDDFHLADELYIKMNSRGRALTRFENLKSKILKLYDDASKEVPKEYNKKFSEIQTSQGNHSAFKSLRDYVSYMLDTKWTDVFWNEWLNTAEHDEVPNVDDMMLSFITIMGIFDHIIYKLDGKLSLARKDELTREINSLMSAKDKNKGVTVRYDKLIELLKENNYAFLFKIIDYFNIFNDDGKLKTYLPASFTFFSEKETFYSITNDYKFGMEYEKKAKAFAYIDYLSNNPSPNPDHLEAWMHFVCNVCSNSYNLANYTDTFCTSIAGLHYLCCEDIVSEIAQKDLSVLATLDIPQIEEEILKMKLSSNPSWGNAIDNAEKDLSYFEGRLRYPLIECCGVDENDIADILKIALFIDYVEKIASIFINASGCPFESELIRAMLSKGDYLMYFNSNNTLLKNADRDNSWRRFLKEKASDNNAYHPYGMVSCDLRDYFRAVIDDPLFDKSNAKSSLLAIAQARDSSIPMWRKLIIDCADILNNTEVNALGKDRFLRWNNETTQYPHKKDSEDNYEIDLIPGSAITGYHAELFSLCKYYELKGKTFGALGSVIYQRAKTNIEQPYFYLGNEDEPIVKVMYQDDCCFRFLMADGTEECNIAFDDVEARLLAINS